MNKVWIITESGIRPAVRERIVEMPRPAPYSEHNGRPGFPYPAPGNINQGAIAPVNIFLAAIVGAALQQAAAGIFFDAREKYLSGQFAGALQIVPEAGRMGVNGNILEPVPVKQAPDSERMIIIKLAGFDYNALRPRVFLFHKMNVGGFLFQGRLGLRHVIPPPQATGQQPAGHAGRKSKNGRKRRNPKNTCPAHFPPPKKASEFITRFFCT
ncbi:MAG: hypothetical protein OSJ28_00640 [Desulfovibrio sp.]|nr:hypothetical protein [Desulfovibrio sp.]